MKEPEEEKKQEKVRTMSYQDFAKMQLKNKAAVEDGSNKKSETEDNLEEKDDLKTEEAPKTMKTVESHIGFEHKSSATGEWNVVERRQTGRQNQGWATNGYGRPRFRGQRSGARGGMNGGRGFSRQEPAPSDGQRSRGDGGKGPSIRQSGPSTESMAQTPEQNVISKQKSTESSFLEDRNRFPALGEAKCSLSSTSPAAAGNLMIGL